MIEACRSKSKQDGRASPFVRGELSTALQNFIEFGTTWTVEMFRSIPFPGEHGSLANDASSSAFAT